MIKRLVVACLVVMMAAACASRTAPLRVDTKPLAQSQSLGTFLVGQQPLTVEWNASTCEGCVVESYEAWVNTQPAVNVAMALRWVMPILPAGTHQVWIHACNTNAMTGAKQCSLPATGTFVLTNPTPVPGTPGAPRIIPPTQVLDSQQIRILADSFSYVHRLEGLRMQEIIYLQSQYKGPIPITYASELTFLNEQLLLLLGGSR